MRVLLVEGNLALRTALTQLLRAEPAVRQVDQASTGQEAVILARMTRPEVVLIDADLREMSGSEVVRLLRAQYPDLCIVGMTLCENADKAEALRSAGASVVVSKSEAQELVAGMRDCYAAHQNRWELAGE